MKRIQAYASTNGRSPFTIEETAAIELTRQAQERLSEAIDACIKAGYGATHVLGPLDDAHQQIIAVLKTIQE